MARSMGILPGRTIRFEKVLDDRGKLLKVPERSSLRWITLAIHLTGRRRCPPLHEYSILSRSDLQSS